MQIWRTTFILCADYGAPIVVAINRFPSDSVAELAEIAAECKRQEVGCSFVEAFAKGGAGATDLAEKIVAAIDGDPEPAIKQAYALDDPLEEKIRKVAVQVYGADGVTLSDAARANLARFTEWGFGRMPVCIAKTQYSLTDNPKTMGAPKGWTLNVTNASLSAGAGFVVAVAGNMMLMPGLPSEPRALAIDVDEDGRIVGV